MNTVRKGHAAKPFSLTSGDLPSLFNEAIDFMRHYEPVIGYFIGFSGGKDSIVLYDLAKAAGVKISGVYYSQTYIDPPEVTRFIREHYPEVVFMKPKMTFWQGILEKDMPLRKRRWCCDVLKKEPTADVPLPFRLFGIRKEESDGRKTRGRVLFHSMYDQLHLHPIFHFSSQNIWEYIKQNNLRYPSLYDEGFKRLGCVVCPFVDSPSQIKKHRKQWPGMYRVLDKYLNKRWEINSRKPSFDISLEDYMKWPAWPTKVKREFLKRQGSLL